LSRPGIHISMLFVLLAVTAGMRPLMAQQSNTFYLMHDVPQSNLLNPAVQLKCKYYIGIPALASWYFSYSNTAFTYNDLAGTSSWNIEGVFDQMHRVDLYSVEAVIHPISLGYRRKTLYFTFNIAERLHGYQTVPGDLAEMAVHGNGPFVGETARFNAFKTGGHHIREYSLGISKVVSPYLTAGIRAKLIFGKANLYTSTSKVGVTTQEDNFGLLLEGDYTLNASFPATITEDPAGKIDGIVLDQIDPAAYLLNRGNPGFALDLGLIYRYNERITISASLLDLGLTRWKTDLNNVHGEGSFAYEGTDTATELVSAAFFSDMRDSLINAFNVTSTQERYTYYLPTQLFLGGTYRFREKISFGVVNRNVRFNSKIHSSLTLSAHADIAERILATVSWSYLNNSLKNIGLGIAFHGKGIQFHAVTDNLLGFFYPFDSRTLNLRIGCNLMLGCPRNRQEKLQEEAYSNLPAGGYCPYPEKPEKIRRKRINAARKLSRRLY
jgi:hypothetical protein